MHRSQSSRRLVGLTALGLAAAACSGGENNTVFGPRLSGANAMFAGYVSLGNSLTAGFQSSGINDSTQRRAYPVLLAAQMRTRFAYPSLAGRGCAPPVVNFLTQARAGTGSTPATCDLRNPSTSPLLNNVAVPNAYVADLTADNGTANSVILTSLFLGGMTQVEKAVEARPTFVSVWTGNNDVLAAAVSGVLAPFAGVSPGITPQATFESRYDAALTGLGAANIEGVLIGVVKVTGAPILFPTDSLRTNATFRAQFDAAAGRVTGSGDPIKAGAITLDPNCSTNTTTLVSLRLASEIARFRNDTNPTGQPPKDPATRVGHPAYIACGVSSTPGAPGSPVGEVFILSATEQAILDGAVSGYNAWVSNKAQTLGWAYLDPNRLLDSLRLAGAIPARPNLTSINAPFGAWVSLDGIHPTDRTHRAVTNHVIDAVNGNYKTTLARITVP